MSRKKILQTAIVVTILCVLGAALLYVINDSVSKVAPYERPETSRLEKKSIKADRMVDVYAIIAAQSHKTSRRLCGG